VRVRERRLGEGEINAFEYQHGIEKAVGKYSQNWQVKIILGNAIRGERKLTTCIITDSVLVLIKRKKHSLHCTEYFSHFLNQNS
jgi:hypothetical protein